MANRRFYGDRSLQREVIRLYMEVAVGSTGAPTLTTGANLGIASITRAAAGDYDVVLEDNYTEIIKLNGALLDAASEDIVFQLAVRDAQASGGATFSFFTNTDATATEVSDGATMQMEIVLRNVKALGA